MTLLSRALSRLCKLPPAKYSHVAVERDLAARMPDGARLFADRWYPPGTAAKDLPVVLLRCPYGRRQIGIVGRLFAERGYQVLIQSCRGTFGSGGDWVPFRNEQSDGLATLEWISSQLWFSGKLGTFGPSYLGLTQLAVFGGAPDFLCASVLDVTSSNFHKAVIYPWGILALGQMIPWVRQLEYQETRGLAKFRHRIVAKSRLNTALETLPLTEADLPAASRHVGFYQDWIEHDALDDPWWDRIDFSSDLEKAPPSSLVGGWYDLFLPSQVEDFVALRSAGRSCRITIGPWAHVSPGGLATFVRDGLDWFEHHLQNSTTAAATPVRLYVMGARRWLEFEEWPPPAEQQNWYLHAGGRLATDMPSDSEPDRYRYDPSDPTPAVGGPSLEGAASGPKDQRPRESRSDVLTYTSEAMIRSLTVVGPLKARIHLRSTLLHTDLFVRLCVVSQSGRSKNLADGIVRIQPGSRAISGDGSVCAEVAMWPTASTFKVGQRVRLQVSSGAHPLFARNSGTGEPIATATELRVADQEILHDPDHPSRIELPVIQI
jgi:putative CocE/NonD family hydrolase